ncbi:MAG: beta-lactamase family protein [Verrucomicrobiae bacterium]|nr:beta-lactamase family protein [Verrucomicrobiae bacterium]
MRRRHFLRVTTGVALAAGVVPKAAGAQASRLPRRAGTSLSVHAIEQIAQLLPRLLRERNVAGATLGVISDGRLAWQGAYGFKDSASREPVDAQTAFEAASISKTVFAYAVLKLCERGTLALDQPLTAYTRMRFVADDTRLDRVTARRALSHTTGFPEWRAAQSLQFEANPGERFRYSGEGYYYLQSVLTEVASRTLPSPCGRYEGDLEVCATDFEDFMQRSLLGPLGMAASGYLWRESFERSMARPHGADGQPLPRKKPNAADIARYGAVGELRTTVSDYAKFLLAVLNRPEGDAFLGVAMRDEMICPQVKLDPAEKIDGADSWALGWAVQERPTGHVILHSGGQTGFRSLAMMSVERQAGFVIFTNSDNGGHVCYNQELGRLLTPLLAR